MTKNKNVVKVSNAVGVSGRYLFFKNGKPVGASDNVITDGFLARWPTSNTGPYGWLYLGTGTTPPAESNTTIGTYLANTQKYQTSANAAMEFNGGYVHKSFHHFNYTDADFTGTFTEAAFKCQQVTSNGGSLGTAIDSHVLIRDFNGAPISLTLGAGEDIAIIFILSIRFPQTSVYTYQDVMGVKTKIGVIERGQAGMASTWCNGVRTTASTTGFPNINNGNSGRIWVHTSGGVLNESVGSSAGPVGATLIYAYGTVSQTSVVLATGSNWVDVERGWLCTTQGDGLATAHFTAGISLLTCCNSSSGSVRTEYSFNPPLGIASYAGNYNFFKVRTRYYIARGSSSDILNAVGVDVYPPTITEAAANGSYTTANAVGYGRGGSDPYTYAWTRTGGTGTVLVADNPSAQSTTFTYNGTSETTNEIWTCTVTDADLNTSTSTVTVDVTWA